MDSRGWRPEAMTQGWVRAAPPTLPRRGWAKDVKPQAGVSWGELGESAGPDHDTAVAGELRHESIAFPGMSDSRLSVVNGDKTTTRRQ